MKLLLVVLASAVVKTAGEPQLVQNPCNPADQGEVRFSEAWLNAQLVRQGHAPAIVCRRDQTPPELAEEYAKLSPPELEAEEAMLRAATRLSKEMRLESLRRMKHLRTTDPEAAAEIGVSDSSIAVLAADIADDPD